MKQIESFFWGILAALGALVLEIAVFTSFSIFSNSTSLSSFSQFFIIPQFIVIAVLVEEIFKYIVISKRIATFSSQKSYLINAFFVGLGFFGIELLIISMAGSLPDLKFLTEIAIVHIGTAGLIGFIIHTNNPEKVTTFFQAILIATVFHAIYNFLNVKRGALENHTVFFLLALLILINIAISFRINRALAQD